MKLLFLSLISLTCALPNNLTINNDTSLDSTHEGLNIDMLEKIAGLVDDKTAFALSHTSNYFKNQTLNRINKYKFEALKRNCPNQFNYLTKNGNVVLMNSFKPAERTYESLEIGDTKEDVMRMLHQRRLCIQSMLQAKDLIADRLDQIAIALPPKATFNEFQRRPLNYYSGNDADVELSIEKYYASIKLLIDTGFVKKLEIYSAFDGDLNELHPLVEEKLYQFLLLIKVPAISFHINLNDHFAFGNFATKARFLRDLYLCSQNSVFSLPASIETLVIADQTLNLKRLRLPKLKSLTLIGRSIPDMTLDHPRLESLKIKYMADNSALDSICSVNNDQLIELSIELTSDDIDTGRLRSCLMALKPQLRKFAFGSTFALKSFWNDFASEFLQDNAILEDFSVKYDLQYERIDSTDVSFLIDTYSKLNLTKFRISGDLQNPLIVNAAVFISKQTSLTRVNLESRIEIEYFSDLETIFEKISEIKSVKEFNLTYGVRGKENAIEEYLKKFITLLSILEERSLIFNGVAIESVKRDLNIELDESFVWRHIESYFEGEKSVILLIAAKDRQYEF